MDPNGRRWALALAWLGLCAAPAGATGPPHADGFVLEESVGGCALRLEAPPSEPRMWRLRAEAACALGPDEVRDTLHTLLRRALAAPGPPEPPTSFLVGRIVTLPWLSERLAASALASPDWDAARGAPRSGHENRFVAAQIEGESLHRELVEAFRRAGLRVAGVSVEKVLVGTPRDGAPAARLPYDAILWLRLEP